MFDCIVSYMMCCVCQSVRVSVYLSVTVSQTVPVSMSVKVLVTVTVIVNQNVGQSESQCLPQPVRSSPGDVECNMVIHFLILILNCVEVRQYRIYCS